MIIIELPPAGKVDMPPVISTYLHGGLEHKMRFNFNKGKFRTYHSTYTGTYININI
jgi:hypothetical protein